MGLHIRNLTLATVVSPDSLLLLSSNHTSSTSRITVNELFNSLDYIVNAVQVVAGDFVCTDTVTTLDLRSGDIVVNSSSSINTLNVTYDGDITIRYMSCVDTDFICSTSLVVKASDDALVFSVDGSTAEITVGPYTSAVSLVGSSDFVFTADTQEHLIHFDTVVLDRLSEWDSVNDRFFCSYADNPYSVFYIWFTANLVSLGSAYTGNIRIRLYGDTTVYMDSGDGFMDTSIFPAIQFGTIWGLELSQLVKISIQADGSTGQQLALRNMAYEISRYA